MQPHLNQLIHYFEQITQQLKTLEGILVLIDQSEVEERKVINQKLMDSEAKPDGSVNTSQS